MAEQHPELVVTFMKVLEVQRVVRDLINGIRGVTVLANLVLDDKDCWADDQYDINTLSHSGDRVLEIDRSGLPDEHLLQALNLGEPSVSLRLLHGKLALSSKLAKNRVGIFGQKVRIFLE